VSTHSQKLAAFCALHNQTGAFVIPNAWNAGTTRILASIGFPAIATTSAGLAFSGGKRDSHAVVTRAEILANAAEIVAATDLPVSADLEDGFGPEPETCAQTIALAADAGLVGGTLEDATGDPNDPIYPFSLAVERIAAAVEVARTRGFVLTARAEGFLWGRPDLDDAIRRLLAFEAAGADVLYAPGLPDIEAIRLVCGAVSKPVNVVMGLSGPLYSVDELAAVGVKRISVGGSFARAAYGALIRAAREVHEHGTFGYARDAISGSAITALMAELAEEKPRRT
jgi:2-methylisocitrate lyase-like PEP mutase family enzyme